MADVRLSGPLFNGQAQAAAAKAVRAIQDKLAAEGRKMAAAALSGSIRVPHTGRAVGDITITDTSMVVETASGHKTYTMPVTVNEGETVVTSGLASYGPWLEGTGSRNQTTRFKGYFSFRLATQELDDQAEGIADETLQPYLEEMR